MVRITDDLGQPVTVGSPHRLVSLVPSLTEAIAASAAADALVGATDWCTHPADLAVTRVRGTKNPDLAAIRALRPDLVIANREENRELDVRRLRESGVAVWVTDIRSLDDAFRSLRRLFAEALGTDVPAWLGEADAVWAEPPVVTGRRAVVPVWRDPWLVVGSQTFTGDVVARLGLVNVFGEAAERYPRVELDAIGAHRPDLVLLPDEPYRFTADDGPEAFPGVACPLVEGRLLTWYGPSLVVARAALAAAVG
ncbi:hypothetical protein SAMN05443575_0909 [Jatrophihabitans endophyticus]|uniref:Fe/B12 periplasmic-binding domain-containing protein n=1 Tax=Jatrophihabitans endophyticus TaxID=1206085 RepID=A0A1M5EJ36_9ACTN|nr:helical backbone metal receptor [Jatrophihabitans endophyticus]SHF79176.1 hypothetical protein SAMN05443575_0909 [Jatrophihabitans endophyticus]